MTEEAKPSGPQADTAVSVAGPSGGETTAVGITPLCVPRDGSRIGHCLAIAESVLVPHAQGPPPPQPRPTRRGLLQPLRHRAFHRRGREDHDATGGTLVMGLPGTAHSYVTPTDQLTVLLSTLTPDLYARYVRDLSDVLADGRRLTP
ncbi:cupin domain-containing protein [Streptomyces melanogenes]|uniref:cupin domain-containing protein n=1 Tax=Streptomyces melanogenes TaxID=67326 RepID=UPI002E357F18|nr:cupin domain-containing protein [Streptomyces melanogenes]